MDQEYEKPPPYTPFPEEPSRQQGSSSTFPPTNAHPPTNLNPSGFPNYGATYQPQVAAPQVIIIGGCPSCHLGVMEDDFSVLGVICAIVFFPLGILCCLAMKTRRCRNCGLVLD